MPEGTTEEASRPPRRRGRTALLIAVAAVLGVVAGTCTGFVVQANRAPDKLPSLSQATLTQAKGPAPEPLSAAQDHRVKTDGDLRKLLLRKPSGATATLFPMGSDGWLTLADYAETYVEPDGALGYQSREEFRRAAVTDWMEGSREVDIYLVQYRQEDSLGAVDAAKDALYYADRESRTDSWTVPGTADGKAYVHHADDDGYTAEAHAYRGDIYMEIWVYDSKPITKAKIMDLAKRQMERL
ncbi:hypothetical protein [Streptomyces sp. cg40]|uniref:hypothetical protein n=1 Tax=Streptomyces sp. cg40 TaxID=3419764 RepID=UPI003D01EF1B